MNDIIICRLDGKKMLTKHLSRHLKLHHQKDYKEYIKENISDFKPTWNFCSICENLVKGKACSGECLKKYYSKIRLGILKGPMSELSRKKLSDTQKRKYENGWAPREGKFHTEESNQKNSSSHRGKKMLSIKGELNPACRLEVREKISNTRISRGVAKGVRNGMFGKTHTPEVIKKIFSHRKMNKLEKLVADELDKNKIEYTFQYFIVKNGICKSYDFKIKNFPLILEVDGDFWHGNPNTTNHYDNSLAIQSNDMLKDSLALERGIKVVRLWESDIKRNPSIVERTILPYIYT
jgi:very-short-patch-repair endonuclease